MLLFISFIATLLGYTLVSYLRSKNLSVLLSVVNMIIHLFTAHKFFSMALLATAALHLWGHIALGPVAYNESGFDMLTHTLLGFFVIGTTDKVGLFSGKSRRLLLLVTLAVAFYIAHEVQEDIQQLIPGLASQVNTDPVNQARDFGLNLVGTLGYLLSNRPKKI